MSTLERIANRGISVMTRAMLRHIQSKLQPRYITRDIHDYKMTLDLKDPGISRALNLFGERELDMKFMLERFVKPGMTVFDIGSNIGYYPLLILSLLRGSGKVVCIEPLPANVSLLKQNLILNGYFGRLYGNMPIVEAAVSDRAKDLTFHLSEFSNLGTFHPVETSFGNGKTIQVRATTIAELSDRYGNPDLIRMDIEGHEVEVIKGLIADKQFPIIIFEVHTDRYSAEHDFVPVLKALFKRGYGVPLLSSGHSGVNWIEGYGYKPGRRIATDATYRTLFDNIRPDDAIDLICNRGGVRTVVLKQQS